METEDIKAAAVAENLLNPDGTEISTEEQLVAARELAAAAAEEVVVEETPEQKEARELKEAEEAAAADPLLKVMMEELNPIPAPQVEEPIVVVPAASEDPAALEAAAKNTENIKLLTQWKVTVPADATPEWIATEVGKGEPKPVETPKKKKFSVVKSREVVESAAARPAPAATPPPTSTDGLSEADLQYIATLTPEQQDELEEAGVAELLEPARFKGQKQKLLEYFRRFDKEVSEIKVREPDANLEENQQVQALARAKPALDPVVVKKVNRHIGANQGVKQAKAELQPEMDEMQRTQRRIELTPRFQKFVVEEFRPGVDSLFAADATSPMAEAFKVIKEKGIEAARSEGYKLEAKAYEEEMAASARRVEKFLLLKNDAVPFDTKKPDPDHLFVMEYVDREGIAVAEYEKKHGRLVDKARDFLPRREFNQMLLTNPAEAATLDRRAWKTKSFCTFTDIVLLDGLAKYTKSVIENRIKEIEANAETVGFERRPRNKTTTTTTPKPAPKEINPPRSVPAPATGAVKKPVTTQETEVIDVLGTNYPHLIKKV